MSTPPSTNGTSNGNGHDGQRRILYCRCAYAKIIPPEVKDEVLAKLSASGVGFEAVADLCEMSARRDPALARLAGSGTITIAACYPRAVKWLFHAAGTPLPDDGVEILNMREQSANEVVSQLLTETASSTHTEPRASEAGS